MKKQLLRNNLLKGFLACFNRHKCNSYHQTIRHALGGTQRGYKNYFEIGSNGI